MARELSEQEREGWQLLLWSYRHELDVHDTFTHQRDDQDPDEAWALGTEQPPS
jgi:hypothetical protein